MDNKQKCTVMLIERFFSPVKWKKDNTYARLWINLQKRFIKEKSELNDKRELVNQEQS